MKARQGRDEPKYRCPHCKRPAANRVHGGCLTRYRRRKARGKV